MGIEANKALFRRFYGDTWNTGDTTLIDELLAPDFVNHELVDVAPPHRELYKQAIRETKEASPDFTVTIEDLIAEGDQVAARWHAAGTHSQGYLGQPATGKHVELRGITVVRIIGGRIAEFWKHDNSYTTPRQLGIVDA
jgi:steroid delta-isomerase-like uncharacterized protein